MNDLTHCADLLAEVKARIQAAQTRAVLERVKDVPQRRWYITQAVANGWSRSVLQMQIESAAHIGLMLCQGKDKVLAEYALRGIDKPIGIASYELTRALPETLQSALPSIEALEAELAGLPPMDTE